MCPTQCPAAPCEQYLAAEAARRRAVLLVYSDAELMVELISEQDLPTAFTAAGAGEVAVVSTQHAPSHTMQCSCPGWLYKLGFALHRAAVQGQGSFRWLKSMFEEL